jgi:hypothetical protein
MEANMRGNATFAATAFASLCLTTLDAGASQQVSTTFQMPVRLQAAIAASGCNNSPGPKVTIQGALFLGGLGLDLIFRNNQKGTHELIDMATVEVSVVPAGESVSVPKQPVLGGTGGNPFIWFQLMDGNGNPLTGEVFLGRCVQGNLKMAADFALLATAAARFASTECDNSPGPYITIDGDVALSGLNGRLVFRNNDNPVGGPHDADDEAVVNLVILPPGMTSEFPKSPAQGGVGGNPLISVLFRHGDGDPIGSEFLLGRCVQLSK